MRIFLGIDIPEKTKTEIDLHLAALKKEYPQFSWVPRRNYHVTIHYFGEVQNVSAVENRLSTLLYDVHPFHLFAYHGGIFQQLGISMYIEFSRDKTLEHMVDTILDDVASAKLRKKYIPHVTIARYKVPSKQQYLLLRKKLENLNLDFNFPVESVYLFESDLKGAVPVYKKIKEYTLQK